MKGTPHIWVSFDEWTDSVGNTVVDILVGVGNQSYVVQTVTLECLGPNMGVEHTEFVAALIDTLGRLGLATSDIGFYIFDGASVVGAAVRAALPFFPNAKHVVCVGHRLNNRAKALLTAPGFKAVTEFYETARAYVHAKKHSAKKEALVCVLQVVGLQCSCYSI